MCSSDLAIIPLTVSKTIFLTSSNYIDYNLASVSLQPFFIYFFKFFCNIFKLACQSLKHAVICGVFGHTHFFFNGFFCFLQHFYLPFQLFILSFQPSFSCFFFFFLPSFTLFISSSVVKCSPPLLTSSIFYIKLFT